MFTAPTSLMHSRAEKFANAIEERILKNILQFTAVAWQKLKIPCKNFGHYKYNIMKDIRKMAKIWI